jgi:hypothetical protein
MTTAPTTAHQGADPVSSMVIRYTPQSLLQSLHVAAIPQRRNPERHHEQSQHTRSKHSKPSRSVMAARILSACYRASMRNSDKQELLALAVALGVSKHAEFIIC